MYLTGHGRNEIVRLLDEQGLHISEGSVGNIVRAYRKHEQPSQPDANTNNTNSSSSITSSRLEQAVTVTNGAPPLLRFLKEDTTGNPDSPGVNPSPKLELEFVDFDNKPYPEFYPNPHIANMQVNVEPDFITQNAAPEEEEEFKQPKLQLQSSLSDSENPLMDWDSEEVWERRFLRIVFDDKKQRQHQLQLIERRQQELDEQKRQIENIRQDLEARENKLRSVEDLIPSSKHLKDIGIRFDQALVWVDCIKEVAQKERIDERTAAWKLADILRSFKELSDLEKAIQQATQQLAMLNMVNDQQKRAINTLVHLQQIGMTEDEIVELVKLVGRWNGVGVGQGNGISSINRKLDDKLIGVGH